MNEDVNKKIRLDDTTARAVNPIGDPEKALLYAIIEQAVKDLQQSPPGSKDYLSAIAFFKGKEYSYIADVLEISICGKDIIRAIKERA